MMTVSVLSLSAYGSDEIAVAFEIGDGEHTQIERLVISTVQCADLRLRSGDADERLYDEVLYASQMHTALKQGMSMLSFGGCSEKALLRKLIAKGNTSEAAEEAVAELVRLGYMDPFSDAQREAERGVVKLWGRLRITASLREKGYSDESVRAALAHLRDSGVDYPENCALLIRRRWGEVPSDPDDRRKMVAALMHYGYTTDEIRAACRLI